MHWASPAGLTLFWRWGEVWTSQEDGTVVSCRPPSPYTLLVNGFLIAQTKLKRLQLSVSVSFVLPAMIQPFGHFTSSLTASWRADESDI